MSDVRWSSEQVLQGGTQQDLDEDSMALAVLQSRVQPGSSTMVDVGADSAESVKAFLQADWNVWVIAPDRANRSELLAHLVDADHMPRRVDRRAPDGTASSDGTATVRLDDFMQAQNITNVDYLKIVTQGGELEALQGFPFASVRPKVILCAFDDDKTIDLGYSHNDLAIWLEELGYQVLASEWYPSAHGQRSWRCISEFRPERLPEGASGNFLCFDRAVSDAELERAVEASLRTRIDRAPSTATAASAAPTTRAAVDACQFDEVVELLHEVVSTLARHERSIRTLDIECLRGGGLEEARMNP